MITAWKGTHEQRYQEPRDFFFYGEAAIVRKRFEEVMFGAPRAMPADNQKEKAAETWRVLKPRSLELSEIKGEVAVSETAACRVRDRYQFEPVQLPFPDEPGHPPHAIWSDWFVQIANRLSPEIEQVQQP